MVIRRVIIGGAVLFGGCLAPGSGSVGTSGDVVADAPSGADARSDASAPPDATTPPDVAAIADGTPAPDTATTCADPTSYVGGTCDELGYGFCNEEGRPLVICQAGTWITFVERPIDFACGCYDPPVDPCAAEPILCAAIGFAGVDRAGRVRTSTRRLRLAA